jgi:exodeoxyribonuclease VII small subunit
MKQKANRSDASTFAETMKRLEAIVSRLEEGNVPLEESIRLYEEGIILSKECMEKLNQAEKRVKVLGEDMSGNFVLDDTDEEL